MINNHKPCPENLTHPKFAAPTDTRTAPQRRADAIAGIRWSPLAVGRLNRFATPAQRAALHHRDGGCIYRGCTRPARSCHAHHIIDWRDGGTTDLPNLVLLCAYHHRMIHLGRAQITDDPTGQRIATPTRRHTTTAA